MANLAFRSLQRLHMRRSFGSTAKSNSKENRGMNASVFRSVFETIGPDHPAAKLQLRRYQRRWDWHLRNLIYALMPPAAVYGSVVLIRWFMADEITAYNELLKEQEKDKEKEGRLQLKTKTVEERLQIMEKLITAIEKERQQAARDRIVEEAKSVLKQVLLRPEIAKTSDK